MTSSNRLRRYSLRVMPWNEASRSARALEPRKLTKKSFSARPPSGLTGRAGMKVHVRATCGNGRGWSLHVVCEEEIHMFAR
jgi:hypothetical protein